MHHINNVVIKTRVKSQFFSIFISFAVLSFEATARDQKKRKTRNLSLYLRAIRSAYPAALRIFIAFGIGGAACLGLCAQRSQLMAIIYIYVPSGKILVVPQCTELHTENGGGALVWVRIQERKIYFCG